MQYYIKEIEIVILHCSKEYEYWIIINIFTSGLRIDFHFRKSTKFTIMTAIANFAHLLTDNMDFGITSRIFNSFLVPFYSHFMYSNNYRSPVEIFYVVLIFSLYFLHIR